MNQTHAPKSKRIKLRAFVWLFALLSVAHQITYANDNPAPDFSHDLGLSPEFIAAHISPLRVSSGQSHYRMRYYEFEGDEIAHEKIVSLFAKQRVQSSTLADPASRMINTLVGIGRPNARHTWVWTEVFPPYRQRFIACYPDKDPDYGFRWLEIQPSRASKRTALLAVGNRVPTLNGVEFFNCGSMKLRQLAEFYSPISTASSLPYPFARRSFREMLRSEFKPQSLNYFGFIFVDARHWFRFSASKTEFEELMLALAMQPVAKPQEVDFDYGAKPEWWRISAGAIQWMHCARFPAQLAKPGAAVIDQQRLPLHIYAAWESGFGFVVMDSGASSKFATDSCE